MSLLKDHGHPYADFYTIPNLVAESDVVEARINSRMASEAVLIQLAVASMFSKESGKLFVETISDISKGNEDGAGR